MRQNVPPGPLVGLAGVLALLTALDAADSAGPGPGVPGWTVGLACGTVLCVSLAAGLARASRRALLPADRVTLARAVLVCGVAALAVGTVASPATSAPLGTSTAALVALSSVALALDAVDGKVARRTRTVHPLGARFDMETDAFLILVLSAYAARHLGWWVLGIGAARYLLLLVAALGRWAPWLRGQVPARRWRKVVAAYQGIALTVAVAGVLPGPAVSGAVALGLGLLLVSFGTELVTLRRLGREPAAVGEPGAARAHLALPRTAADVEVLS